MLRGIADTFGALFIMVLTIAMTTPAMAAGDEESLSPFATGSVHVSLFIPARMHVRGLRDISVDTTAGGTSRIQDVCVFSSASDSYAVTALSRNADDSFVLRAGQATLGYRVAFAGTTLRPGQRARMTGSAAGRNGNCAGTSGVQLEVTMPQAPARRPAGDSAYSDVLTLVFEAT